ncbi:ABC transporter permease [Lichenicola cladoniae]|uniref:ABC transporter permease n=1 Tax=Lichenicola cladoniae TaxID=1484109 RepID=A0A6M8HLL5_9PROT|nr:ABC transporter permease [Lichenicola cladoniae]QKE89232.1 ABC transporter permease [Lichenicola cladoniae]
MTRLRRSTALGAAGATLLAIAVLVAVTAPLIAPWPPMQIDLRARFTPPFWEEHGALRHLLGTDNLGRDIASRIIWGARISLGVGVAAALLGAVIGGTLGLCAGFFGRQVDAMISWLIDVQLAFPFTLFALFLLAVFGGGPGPVVVVLALATWVNYARVVRAQVMALRSQDFILAARAVGVPSRRILLRYLLPAVAPVMMVVGSFSAAQAILTQAALSFLGVGVDPSSPSWGAMLDLGRSYILSAWWMATFPGVTIALVVLGANLLGDWLRERLDPLAASRR